MPKITIGRSEEDVEEFGPEPGTGLIGKHIVGEKKEAHTANPIHMDLARPHVLGIFGKRGSGKCLHPEEKVLTGKGNWIEIEELFRRLEEKGEKIRESENEMLVRAEKDIEAVSISEGFDTAKKKVKAGYRKKVDEDLIQLDTAEGREITVTKEHPLLTPKGWKNASQIGEGESIAIPREIDIKPSTALEIPQKLEEAQYRTKKRRECIVLEKVKNGSKKVAEMADGSGSFYNMVHQMENKGLADINGSSPATIQITEKGRKTLSDRKTTSHYTYGKATPIKLPEKVSHKLARFIAYTIAEGHEQKVSESNYRIIFTNNDENLISDYSRLCRQLFDLQVKNMDDRAVYLNSTVLEKFLQHNGYNTAVYSREKEIPDFILSSPIDCVREFLSAYIDSESHIRRAVEIPTASKKLAGQLIFLLNRIGVHGKIIKKKKEATNANSGKKTYYCIFISESENLERLEKKLNLRIEKKRTALKEAIKESNPNKDLVPGIGEKLKEARVLIGASRPQIADFKQSLKAYEDEKYHPSRDKLAEIISNLKNHKQRLEELLHKVQKSPRLEDIEKLVDISKVKLKNFNSEMGYDRTDKRVFTVKKHQRNPEKAQKAVIRLFKQKHNLDKAEELIEELNKYTKTTIFWDKIEEKKTKKYKGPVYDLTVEDNHNFIGGYGGIYCHNSYTLGCIAEELVDLEEEVANNLSTIIVDSMGIYWSMKFPNEEDAVLLDRWDMQPDAMDLELYIPEGQAETFQDRGIPYDKTFTLSPEDLSAGDWAMAFDIPLNSSRGILLEQVVRKLEDRKGGYGLQDMIELTRDQKEFEKDVRRGLVNRFQAAQDWGIFSKNGTDLDKFTERGKLTILDLSLFGEIRGTWSVRTLVVGLLANKILRERMASKRLEEMKEMEGIQTSESPIVWMLIDEAHQFLPNEGETPATDPLLSWVKIGREPGVSLALATQQPYKLDPRALSQCDLILSHRLTAKSDIEALKSIMQTYMQYDLTTYIDNLPRKKGAAICLDDNSERVYSLRVRPRKSWHAGGTPIALKEGRT